MRLLQRRIHADINEGKGLLVFFRAAPFFRIKTINLIPRGPSYSRPALVRGVILTIMSRTFSLIYVTQNLSRDLI